MGIRKQTLSKQRQQFLLDTFFKKTKHIAEYELVSIGDYILNKYVSGDTGKCYVAIYPKEKFYQFHHQMKSLKVVPTKEDNPWRPTDG